MNFIRLKKIIIFIFTAPALLLSCILILNLFNKPLIKSVETSGIKDFAFNTPIDSALKVEDQSIGAIAFDFELIGYRSGSSESSVILKKGNKEYVVAEGEKLVGKFELIEVNKDELYEGNVVVEKLDEFLDKYRFVRIETKWFNRFVLWGDALYVKAESLSSYKILKSKFDPKITPTSIISKQCISHQTPTKHPYFPFLRPIFKISN